jgi:organic radical activating enzyme|tara:strand:+ start:810 stop:1955 length:1146 start_codon:yes stop_codon:yes gene_type:complete
MLSLKKSNFCSFPFNTIFLGADAGVKTCCSARGEIGDLNISPISDIIQSDIVQDIRQHIIDNKWHSQCSQCKQLEDMGSRSERMSAIEHNYENFKDIKLTSNYFKLQKLDLRWSNTCNLACNYCYEYFSSQWANIKGIKVNDVKADNVNTLLMYIEQNKDTVSDINLLGGEPFLQKQNSRLLDILKNKKYYVLTNLAVPLKNNKIALQVLNEPNAEWGVSFETVRERFEYVRHGAKWDQFINNINFIKSVKPDLLVNAHPLYCTYSAFNLVEYYDYVLNEKLFNSIYWCVIQNIDGLNVLKLSKNLKEKAIKEIEKCEIKFKGATGIDHLIDIKNTIIASLNDTVTVKTTFNTFTSTIESQLNKDVKFNDLWPDLAKELVA